MTGIIARAVCGVAAALLSLSAFAQAGTYPNRPVRLVLGFAPGGSTDLSARILGTYLEKQTGQPIVIENRPGAFTQLATDAVAKSAPDGYSLLWGGGTYATEPLINKAWTARIDKDIVPIAMFARFSIAISVNPSLPINNLRDLVTWAKANPGKLTQSLAVTPSPDIEELKGRLGIESLDVPYKGAQAMIQAVLAGDAHFAGLSIVDLVPLAQTGKLRPIAYLEKERHPLLPNMPTVSESGVGLDGFDATYWFGAAGPGGISPDLVTRIHALIQGSLKDPGVVERLSGLTVRPFVASIAETRARVAEDQRNAERRVAAGLLKPRQ